MLAQFHVTGERQWEFVYRHEGARQPVNVNYFQTVKLIGFDLDDTLAHSKSAISKEMSEAIHKLLKFKHVLIISGARFEQFESQVLQLLPSSDRLEKLHLMPTCGTRYLRWRSTEWIEEYSRDLPAETKSQILDAIESESRRRGFWGHDDLIWGERIEDRGSQITYSALGQQAPIEAKRSWDPDGSKKESLRNALQSTLVNLEVRAGGSTSIDVTEKGIDKAYGVGQLARRLNLTPAEIHFVGDRLDPGGNDFPVLSLGVGTKSVNDCNETLQHIRYMLQSFQAGHVV